MYINLTTPEGKITILKSEVVAVSESKNKSPEIKTEVWIRGVEDSFNILEEYDDVFSLL